jgi:RNA polymerase sigma factor (sigma-70 family)
MAAADSDCSQHTVSEHFMVSQIKRGDPVAFETLVRQYHGPLVRYCHRILGRWDDADDAAQEALLTVLRFVPTTRRELRLRPWLFRVAHNTSISMLRTRRDHAELPADELLDLDAAPEEALEEKESLAAVLSDIAALPDDQRQALTRAAVSGQSGKEIAQALGCDHGRARTLIYQGRQALIRTRQERLRRNSGPTSASHAGRVTPRASTGHEVTLPDAAPCRAPVQPRGE